MNATQLRDKYHLRLIRPNVGQAEKGKQVKLYQSECEINEFTDREIDILSLMAAGLTADMVADQLHISPHTVKTHQRNMLKKSGCSNGIHLVAHCMREGIIE